MPPASRAADTGPLTFSEKSLANVAMIVFLFRDSRSLADRGGFGNEGTKHAGDCGSDKGEDKEDHHCPAFTHLFGKSRTVVTDDEGDDGGSDGGQKGNMFLPFHAEFMPLGGIFTGQQQELRKGREIGCTICGN